MGDEPRVDAASLPLTVRKQIDARCQQFEDVWRSGGRPGIEDYLGATQGQEQTALFRELLLVELSYRSRRHERPTLDEYLAKFPDHGTTVRAAFEDTDRVWTSTAAVSQPDASSHAEADRDDQPLVSERIGRYLIRTRLGAGAFAFVYEAYDPELERTVAVKVPRSSRFSSRDQLSRFVEEARRAAQVQHPGIVAIHDILRDDERICVVQEYVAGQDLAAWVRSQPEAKRVERVTELMIAIAEAVGYAHRHGLVHRDLKPANILIDYEGHPRVVDFGLALRENSQQRREGEIAGTPPYMSPEQVRGESHRINARSDIWSLGAVLYEMLTGRLPFPGRSLFEFFAAIERSEPTPPGQIEPSLPRELERICLKCLSKRMTDRYATTAELADDLRHWRQSQATSKLVDGKDARILCKGLRTFDAEDADFFLQLLPGPHDRHGLPESIRFWKTRIEQTDLEATFPVGLLYGPSGCGKSSLVRAGLLPRLADHVVAVYVESTPSYTESRLRARLRKQLPDTPEDLSLPELLESIREGQGLPRDGKLLIVLDQFEQWLHAGPGEQSGQLISALRHCDGGRVQGLLMVRDEFWLAVSRFLSDLEVPLVQGRNAALVDLFDVLHARNVLAHFGRGFGCLPATANDLNPEHDLFLQQAIEALAPEGKVVCVRLALFAEMMKGRPWTPDTLQRVGGAEGIGVAFLEEAFSAPTASPENRVHARAAQAVLEILLPAPGTDIKTRMRHYDELLDASGYGDRPKQFESLLGILDQETRLITPTDAVGTEGSGRDAPPAEEASRYYQLTHDYLVGPLREWLKRKRKETSRGRAELRLAERAAEWSAKPESRNLPAWWEDVSIRIRTRSRRWTSAQRQMMHLSGRRHAARAMGVVAVLIVLIWGSFEMYGFARAVDLISNLIKADIGGIPQCIEELKPFRRWAHRRLVSLAEGDAKSNDKLRASLALAEHDISHLDYLLERMLAATPQELEVICQAIEPHKTAVTARLWRAAQAGEDDQRRFNAACALARFASPEDPRWISIDGFVSSTLVETLSRHPRDFEVWLRVLAPQRRRLASSLSPLVYDRQRSELQRDTALNILAEYIEGQPAVMAEVLMEATPSQFERLYPLARSHSSRVVSRLESELKKPLTDQQNDGEMERLGQRQARAAIALLRMGRPAEVRPLLRATPDPRARTYFVHWACEFRVEASKLIDQLVTHSTGEAVAVQQTLLLSLGGFPFDQLPRQQQQPLVATLLAIYRSHPDPGLHGAASWLLRRWGQDEGLVTVDEQLKESEAQLRSRPHTDRRCWYVNSLGDTYVILDAGQFMMGSPDTEPDREASEVRHSQRIGYTFAIAATEVTRRQFQKFLRSVHGSQVETDYAAAVAEDSPTEDSPAVRPTWFDAAEYCNWLSKYEGIPQVQWCYEPNEHGEFHVGMKPARNYLTLTGYRLPTEAEWEYACRGGTLTSRHYGTSSELLAHYGWYEANSDQHVWPVAGLQPNDFGLFDVLGNVYEWCHERYQPYPNLSGEHLDNLVDIQKVEDRIGRVKRGGSFRHFARHLRSASRGYGDPDNRSSSLGFRPVRTFH